jgi:hypothetical protein
MALTAPQALWARRQVVAEVFGTNPVTVTKTDIDTSINALVSWIEANVASAQASLNGTPLAGASAAVKAEALSIAIRARYGDINGVG